MTSEYLHTDIIKTRRLARRAELIRAHSAACRAANYPLVQDLAKRLQVLDAALALDGLIETCTEIDREAREQERDLPTSWSGLSNGR